jgi:hypothetical protein
MPLVSNPYRALGIGLSIAGAAIAPVFYFIVGSAPLAAAGISAVILGFTCIALADARPYLSPEACRLLLRTGMENTAALLEELGIKNKAIYLPAALRDGHVQALIPLAEKSDLRNLRQKLPGRLIVRYGPNPEDMALALTTAGSVNLQMLPDKPGPTADEIESSIVYLLSGVLDVADGAKVNMVEPRINVEIRGSRLGYSDIWYYRCLGSPIASIAAAVSSEALEKPIRIVQESQNKKEHKIELEILS